MGADPDTLWLKLLETEQALIPEGLHVLGAPMSAEAIAAQVALMPPGPAAGPGWPLDPAGAGRRPDPQQTALLQQPTGR